MLYSLGALLTVFRPAGQAELRALLAGLPIPEAVEDGAEAEETAETGPDLYNDLQARAAELIAGAIARLDAYETQDLVAGIFRSMGYYTRVTSPGPDRSTDIVASRDPLAVEPPIIRVQVKARPNGRSSASEIRELAGVLDPGDRGVFVSTGGFSREAEADARARRMTLIDAERLQELLVDTLRPTRSGHQEPGPPSPAVLPPISRKGSTSRRPGRRCRPLALQLVLAARGPAPRRRKGFGVHAGQQTPLHN